MKVKKLEDYTFSDLMDLKHEEFDSALEVSTLDLGGITSLKNLLTLTYEQMGMQAKALSELKTENEDKQKQVVDTVQNIYLLMFSAEYKILRLNEKIKDLSGQLQ